MPNPKTSFQFEKALSDLEKLVKEMESGDLSLEKALAHFEQGIGLIRSCQHQLKVAEQKVNQLVEKDEQLVLEPFVGLDNDESD